MPNEFQDFYNAFRKWASKKFGFWEVFVNPKFTFNEFQKFPEYQQWVNEGAPGWGTEGQRIKARLKGKMVGEKRGIALKELRPGDREMLESLGWKVVSTTDEFGEKTEEIIPPEGVDSEEEKPPAWIEQSARRRAGLEDQLLLAQIAQMGKPSESLAAARQEQQNIRFQQLLSPVSARVTEGTGMDERAKIFEEVRREFLSVLNEPGDWVKKWEVQNRVNPFRQVAEERGASEEAERYRSEESRWTAIANALEENPSLLSGQVGMSVDIARNAATNAGIRALSFEEGAFKGQEGRVEALEDETTPLLAPEWLPSFAPGQRAGRQITKEMIAPPSLQLLTRTPWSQREGAAGFAEWSGQSWRDLMEQVAMMAPSQPQLRSARWSPARSRVGV